MNADLSETGAISKVVNDRLNVISDGMTSKNADVRMRQLFDDAASLRKEYGESVYRNHIIPIIRSHDIKRIVDESSIVKHSFDRPRGYPGDADLLDKIYQHDAAFPAAEAETSRGRAISSFILGVPACQAVRERRGILADLIDDTADAHDMANVLSVACGHLREAETSRAVTSDRLGQFVAGDQDERSLSVIETGIALTHKAVTPTKIRVRDVLMGALGSYQGFDLIYAAGLYDYLNDEISAQLTARMFEALRPGGMLLIGNYLPDLWEVAFMEAFMDWYLIYRNEAQITEFAELIDRSQIGNLRYYQDQSGCVGYCEVQKQ